MTLTIPGLKGAGVHRADDRIAELEARLDQAEADNRALTAANETLICELTSTILSASEYSIRAATAEEENGRLKRRVRELGDKVIRAGAEHQRLRQAVINARPQIHEVPTGLVRPYSPVVCMPYVPPADHPAT
ncbi:hypothetical protein ACWD48_19830 [Streptomyces sp. NPDC002519]